MNKSDILQFIAKAKKRRLVDIDLSNRGIVELPDEIGDLEWIETINLSYNNITTLPVSFCKLINLRRLLLTRNKIVKLPMGIGNFQNLVIFDLSYNPLIKIPREIEQISNLVSLDASFCELHSLPSEITSLYNLKILNLEENPLEFPPQKVVKRGLYAIMHFLTMEKRKRESSHVMMQIFNMPKIIQAPFKKYVRYFNQMVSEANHKDVIFNMNFVNQDFYQEIDLNVNVESYLFDIMKYIKDKVDTDKSPEELVRNVKENYVDNRMIYLKTKLQDLNISLDDKITDIQNIKKELKNLQDSLDED